MYAQSSIKRYLDDLAACRPAPGGGSAAALQGALGCALISMVTNYTISNKRYRDVKDKAENSLIKSEKLRDELLRLVDEDVEAYSRLSKLLKFYKKDFSSLAKAYKEACNVPYQICRLVYNGLCLCKELVEYQNKNLITDTAIATLMLEGAFFSAKYNVYINLKYINDNKYIEDIHTSILHLEKGISSLKCEIIHKSEEFVVK